MERPSAPAHPTIDILERLADAVEEVADQVQVLRQVLDEIREEFQWAVRNDRLCPTAPVLHITSMPLDPLAPDFGERLNRVPPEELAALRKEAASPSGTSPSPSPPGPPRQRDLWST